MIKILSLYFGNFNYGGMLQAYALSFFLKKKGYTALQISYERNYKRPSYIRRIVGLTPNKILSRIFGLFFYTKEINSRKEIFTTFQNDFIPHTTKTYSALNIRSSIEQTDIFIVGSDQVWNPNWTEDAFYLSFAPHNKKISYAASFGVTQIPQSQVNRIKVFLSKFAFISVRELAAQRILSSCINKSVQVVLDPTMLLEPNDWKQIASNNLTIRESYAFVYLLNDSVRQRRIARAIARKYGLKILFIPHVHLYFNVNDIGFGDFRLPNVGPREFIEIIQKSSVVITDSFHGCVFSVLFKKEFWVLKRDKDKKTGSTQSRIDSFLQLLELPDRQISANLEKLKNSEEINYDKVFEKLQELRKHSSQWLEDAINY